jgi:hypothetical protein
VLEQMDFAPRIAAGQKGMAAAHFRVEDEGVGALAKR